MNDFNDILNQLGELTRKFNGLINEGDFNEKDIQVRIVKPFLEVIGFKEEWQKYEYPVIKGKQITDITIKKSNKIIMVVEVKNYSTKGFKEDDLHQLTSYLNIKNVEWGVLTNGRDYILVNNKINGEYQEKRVLSFNLCDYDLLNQLKVKYFTYNSIFETSITNYRKILTQFKIYMLRENKEERICSVYISTIERYFRYLEETFGYRKLEYLNKDDFKNFIMHDIEQSTKKDKKEIKSPITIENKYRHITKLYDLFIKNEELLTNPFQYITMDDMLNGLDINYEKRNIYEMDIATIKELLKCYDEHCHNPERNRIILMLCFYCGLSRDDIRYIKVEDIKYESCIIKIGSNEIPVPKAFMENIQNYIQNIRDENAKVDYVFYSNYDTYAGQPLEDGSINKIIRKCNSYSKEVFKDNHIQVNPENIRQLLVKRFFEAGFSIEEIIVITGMKLSNISQYISTDDIIEKCKISSLPKKHPFLELFE